MRRPRVLLAEDHAQTAERLRKLLRPEFEVIAWVEDGVALVERRGAAVAGRDRHRYRDARGRR